MKINITLKDSDGVYDAIRDAVRREVNNISGLSEEERNLVCLGRIQETDLLIEKWFSLGELLTVEVDTKAKTCIVLEKK